MRDALAKGELSRMVRAITTAEKAARMGSGSFRRESDSEHALAASSLGAMRKDLSASAKPSSSPSKTMEQITSLIAVWTRDMTEMCALLSAGGFGGGTCVMSGLDVDVLLQTMRRFPVTRRGLGSSTHSALLKTVPGLRRSRRVGRGIDAQIGFPRY